MKPPRANWNGPLPPSARARSPISLFTLWVTNSPRPLRPFTRREGNGVRHHIHHAAHGAAVEDRGRAAQNLDLSGAEGIGSDLVVGADGRHVVHTETVVQHLHPRPVEAPDDRAPRAGGESAGLDAELGVQSVAEVGGLVAAQAVSAHDGGRLGQLDLAAILKRLRGDDDRRQRSLLSPGSSAHALWTNTPATAEAMKVL